MKICVLGLWHLGTVTSACLASWGHEVVGLDFEVEKIQRLQEGQPPLFEPGLEDLVKRGLATGSLRFTTDIPEAVAGSEVVWVTYDTPVDNDDRADIGFVMDRVQSLFSYVGKGTLLLISSQLPVGTTRRLEEAYTSAHPDKPLSFAYSPENLRLGKAIEVFTEPDRVVMGVRSDGDKERILKLLKPIRDRIKWMSVESAEMTKHAVNAFLATSVAFINEIAILCEQVGADGKEVELGLKSEARIGPKAYLTPGGAFAGGTLARDINFLTQTGAAHNQPTYLLSAVKISNDFHKSWIRHKIQAILGELQGRHIAVWGLTYKPGTDTLRRSSSIELCEWLAQQGVTVQAHDPAVKSIPVELSQNIILYSDPITALQGSCCLVVATEWLDYRSLSAETIVTHMSTPIVIDPNRFLFATLGSEPRIHYISVGKN